MKDPSEKLKQLLRYANFPVPDADGPTLAGLVIAGAAALATLAGTGAALASFFIGDSLQEEFASQVPVLFQAIGEWIVPLGLVEAFAGIFLLCVWNWYRRRYEWARLTFELSTVVSMAFCFLFAVWFFVHAHEALSFVLKTAPKMFAQVFLVAWYGVGTFATIAFLGMHVLLVVILRSAETREAFADPTSG